MSATFTVDLSDSAKQDIVEIVDELSSRSSKAVADRLLDGLLDCVSTLENFPDRGSVPSELAQLGVREFRQVIVRTYRVIYRVRGDAVVVLIVADGRRDMQQLLERRLLGR